MEPMEFQNVAKLTPQQLFEEMTALAHDQAQVIRDQQLMLERFRSTFGRLTNLAQSRLTVPSETILFVLGGNSE
jgi:hypothetical protein